MSSRRVAALGLVLTTLLPLPVVGADAGERAVPVVDLSVYLAHSLVAQGRSLSVGTGQAGALRLRRGGALGVVLPLVDPEAAEANAPALEASHLALLRALDATPELRLPGCRRPRPGIRTWLAIEGGTTLAREPTSVGLWATRGVRFFGLVRDADGPLAASSASRASDSGLTPRGRDVVRRILEAGGLVDAANASDRSLHEVAELSRAAGSPMVVSRGNLRALVDHPRNLDDAALRSIASTGGVVGIGFEPRRLARGKEANLAELVKQLRHAIRVAGADAVAIGSGFEHGMHPHHTLADATRYQRIAGALRDAGSSDKVVRKVMSGNALRVLCPPNRAASGKPRR